MELLNELGILEPIIKLVVAVILLSIVTGITATYYFLKKSRRVGEVVDLIKKNNGEVLLRGGKYSLVMEETFEICKISFVDVENGALHFSQEFDKKSGILDKKEHFYLPRRFRKEILEMLHTA